MKTQRKNIDGRIVHWIGTYKSADKTINQGKETLTKLDQHDWNSNNKIATSEFYNTPAIKNSHKSILAKYTPKHKVALFSLCTSTRPYTNSMKWSKFYEFGFNEICDFIIISTGGVIPIEYEDCYPYLNYDALVDPVTGEETYFNVNSKKLDEFLRAHSYDYCVFLFKPGSRVYRLIETVCPRLVEEGVLKDYYAGPDQQTYQQICDELVANPKLYSYRYNPLAYKPYSYLSDVFKKWGIEYEYNDMKEDNINEWFN